MERKSLVNRQLVNSSNIRAVGYEPEIRILEVEFHGGGLYQYSGVPESVYKGLMQAASKGSYFHHHVKDKYPFRKLR